MTLTTLDLDDAALAATMRLAGVTTKRTPSTRTCVSTRPVTAA